MMLHRVSRLLAPLSLVLLCVPLGCSGGGEPPEKAPPAPVQAVGPRALFLGQWTELTGTTQPLPQHAARISAAVEGRVLSVLEGKDGKAIHEGQEVKQGDIIAQLDPRIAQANRDKAEATLRNLDEQKKQADLAVKRARIEVQRLEDLQKRSSSNASGQLPLVSPVEMERARLDVQDAESKLRGIEAGQEVGAKDLKALTDQLALYTLHSPIVGRLGLLQVMPGQALTVGAPVADVVDLSEVDVLCYAPPHIAAQLTLDQPARLVTQKEDGSEQPGPSNGKVVFLAVQAQAETGNFPVKVRFPNRDLRIRANAIVRVQVRTKEEKERLTIPETALLEDQDPPAVIVVSDLKIEKNEEGKDEKRGKAKKLIATVGVRDRQWHVVEILGLSDPEKKQQVPVEETLFVTTGSHGLRDDDPVRIEEEEEEGEGK